MTLVDIWPDRTVERQQGKKYSVKLVLKNNPNMIMSQDENQVHFYISIDVVIFLLFFRSGMETEVTSVPACDSIF